MSGTRKDEESKSSSSSPVSGAGLGALSALKNKKVLTIAGGIMIVIGLAGMIAIGSDALATIFGTGYEQPEQGREFQIQQYAFMFTMIAGLGLVIYAQVTLQAKRANLRRRNNPKR
jgi:ABC-type nitrate/sulfonate/bicarbonate transport system permease component